MLRNTRIISKISGSIVDQSASLADYLGGSVAMVLTSTDALYLGTDLPFNHRWFEVATVNAGAAVPTIQLFNGSNWLDVVDVIDETTVAGVPFARSGIVSWVPNRQNTGWINLYSTEQMSDLSTLKIYDRYWVKVSFSATVSVTMKHVGHKFSTDTHLFSQYPDLNNSNLMTAFKSGKTNWNDQAFEAAEIIIQNLREMNVIFSKDQILDWPIFKNASVHKTAEIIYNAFGKDYDDERIKSHRAYNDSIRIKAFNVDKNSNARLELNEKKSIAGHFER